MSIESELERLNTAKTDLAAAILKKGIVVPDWVQLNDYPDYIASIPNRISSVGCTAYMKANLGYVNGSDAQKVKLSLDTLSTSYGGIYLSDGGIQIPENGYYLISGQVMVSDGASGAYLGLQIDSEKNGPLMDAYVGFSNAYGVIACSPGVFFLEQDDLVYLYGRIGENNRVNYNGSPRTKLTILRIA